MSPFRKGKFSIIVLFLYLVTLQLCTGTAFYSIYFASSGETTYIQEQPLKSSPKHQIVLKKHLYISNNDKSSNLTLFILSPFTLPEMKEFVYLKIHHQLTSLSFTACGKLKDRAPPQIS